MTNQDKVHWMRRYMELELEIDRLTESMQRWAGRAARVAQGQLSLNNYKRGDVVGNLGEDTAMGLRIMEEIKAVQRGLVEKIERAGVVQAEIEAAIDHLPEDRYRTLMRQRYLHGVHWEKLALHINYSYRQVLRIHDEALCMLQIEGSSPSGGGWHTMSHSQAV